MAQPGKKNASAKRAQSRIAARIFLEPGTSPGYLHPIAGSPPATIQVLLSRDGQPCSITKLENLSELPKAAETGVCWVRVTGLGAIEPLQEIAKFYGLRRLAMEDTLATGWRTKFEQEDPYSFFVLQGPPDVDDPNKSDRLTLFCTSGLIITFEDKPTCVIEHLWQRLREVPASGFSDHLAGFLTYMVLDILIDGFFPHLDQTDEKLAGLEHILTSHVPTREELGRLYQVKRTLITLSRLITPFREIKAEIVKSHPPGADEEFRPYYNDLCDHVREVEEMLETYHEVITSLDETCQSLLANRVNEIVRALTIISTVFMPLSLIAGIYGMNFAHMPELQWEFGYPAILVLMGVIVVVMLSVFRKKKWL